MKVLFIRLSSIGDIVLTTPAVRCLKQQMPQVELHYLVKPEFADRLVPIHISTAFGRLRHAYPIPCSSYAPSNMTIS